MNRTTLVAAACTAAAALTFGLTGPAQAMPADPAGPTAARAAQAKLSCPAGVIGVTSDRYQTAYNLKNGRITKVLRSTTAYGFDVTAIGYFDSIAGKRKATLKLNAVAGDGVPRRLTLTYPSSMDQVRTSSSKYAQTGFAPRLFADGFGFYAYTVNGAGVLHRWSLVKQSNGTFRYAKRTKIGGGYGSLASLQAGTRFTKKHVARDYLYATTKSGALKQIVVPVKRPGKESVRTLRGAGYQGVTELVWSICNSDLSHTMLVAIDPVAERATWTTVQATNTNRPRTKLRGAVTGSADWDLTATY
jgi:hypothetical protein